MLENQYSFASCFRNTVRASEFELGNVTVRAVILAISLGLLFVKAMFPGACHVWMVFWGSPQETHRAESGKLSPYQISANVITPHPLTLFGTNTKSCLWSSA